jgi:oligopeptide/dipeptide ABC transporter ATP-binding protein
VVRAVEDISFAIHEGETLGLVGESGSGKSTTGRLILRLIPATAGACRFHGRDVFALPKNELRALRREMQIVFQDPYGAFNPRMTIGRILGEALEMRGVRSQRDRDAEVTQLLEMVQLPSNVRGRYPHEFSGGQRQRLGIARALAVRPTFLVADEPVSALDVSTQAEIVNLLLDLQQRLGLTMLFVSHDLSVVRVIADRVAVMFAGRILELATSDALYANPLQPYTRELLAAVPLPDPERARRTPRPKELDAPAEAAAGPNADGCPYANRCPHTMEICRREMPPLVDYAPPLGEASPHFAACHWTEQQVKAREAGAGTPLPVAP